MLFFSKQKNKEIRFREYPYLNGITLGARKINMIRTILVYWIMIFLVRTFKKSILIVYVVHGVKMCIIFSVNANYIIRFITLNLWRNAVRSYFYGKHNLSEMWNVWNLLCTPLLYETHQPLRLTWAEFYIDFVFECPFSFLWHLLLSACCLFIIRAVINSMLYYFALLCLLWNIYIYVVIFLMNVVNCIERAFKFPFSYTEIEISLIPLN